MVKSPPITPERTRRYYDLVGLALFFLGAACLFWMSIPQDAAVPAGVVEALRLIAGSGAIVVPVILLFIGTMFLVGYERISFSHSTWGTLLLFVAFTAYRHITSLTPTIDGADANWLAGHVVNAGGYLGAFIGTLLHQPLGITSSYIVLSMMACMGVVLVVDKPVIELVRSLRKPAAAGFDAAKWGVAAVRTRVNDRKARDEESSLALLPAGEQDDDAPPARRGLLARLRRQPKPAEVLEDEVETAVPEASAAIREADPAVPAPVTNVVPRAFQLPPTSLLNAPAAPPKLAKGETEDKQRVLEVTLEQFGIKANVLKIAHGPTVTRYEIQLAPGIKVSKIVSLADNLAMALAAIDVRVEAPIPGKSAIGVEVPNSAPALVTLRECIETPEFKSAGTGLTIALGKDVSGMHKFADLTKMPHLLIGGSTNSGKSACLNSIIAALVYRCTPRDLQMIMIDPKRVELSLWDGIPHLMHPVVKDVKQAAGIFRAALKEMERRYDLFAKEKTRNIESFNAQVEEDERIGYIVIIVDELADLMMQSGPEIETSICRLAQLARATGIHLVIATQRPSVDVITGTIKANIASRISFAVSSQVDSRTILDMNGAERLIGRGDMLYLPMEAGKPIRIQGCYLSEDETNNLVTYLKEQQRPHYSITPVTVGMGGGLVEQGPDGSEDEVFETAVKLIVTSGHASTSMIQRKFKIGYTRAARLLDTMQARGIVGPLDGAKPREILMSRDQVDRMFLQNPQDE